MEYDVLHEVGEQKDWNESFYFNFYDRGNDLCGFMRIGLVPNKKEKTLFCFLMMPDGTLVGTKENVELTDNELRAKSLAFEKIEADKKWALRYEGELTMMDKDGPKPVQVQLRPWLRDADGTFRLQKVRQRREGEDVPGSGQRAHRAGRQDHRNGQGRGTRNTPSRHWARGTTPGDPGTGPAPRFWLWVTCQFNDGLAFNITKLEMDKGEIDAGFLMQDGQVIPIVKVDIAVERHSDDSPAELYMAFYDNEGNVYGTKGVTKKKALLKFEGEDKKHQAIMWETLAKFKIDDETGFGIAEYLIRK